MSRHPAHKSSTYIGFAVNPMRRIRQHNGEITGGARKTHSKRPWEMLLVLHGFPSRIAALQFEWAWQNPLKSKPVRDAVFRAGLSERGNAARKVKVLHEMLAVRPWCRYPLTLRWLCSDDTRAWLLRGCRSLPQSIQVHVEGLDTLDIAQVDDADSDLDGYEETSQAPTAAGRLCAALSMAGQDENCTICKDRLKPPYVKCKCEGLGQPMRAHLCCLGTHFLLASEANYAWVPDGGRCPSCHHYRPWAEWLRMTKQRYPNACFGTCEQGADAAYGQYGSPSTRDDVNSSAGETSGGDTSDESSSMSEGSDSETGANISLSQPGVGVEHNRRCPAARRMRYGRRRQLVSSSPTPISLLSPVVDVGDEGDSLLEMSTDARQDIVHSDSPGSKLSTCNSLESMHIRGHVNGLDESAGLLSGGVGDYSDDDDIIVMTQ